jgi:hypothetical protein
MDLCELAAGGLVYEAVLVLVNPARVLEVHVGPEALTVVEHVTLDLAKRRELRANLNTHIPYTVIHSQDLRHFQIILKNGIFFQIIIYDVLVPLIGFICTSYRFIDT